MLIILESCHSINKLVDTECNKKVWVDSGTCAAICINK